MLAAGTKPDAIQSGLQFYFAGDTSSLVAVPGGTGTADGTTWSSSGPALAGITMGVDYGDGTYDTGAAGVSKTYASGKGRHRVRLTCPDWNRVTSLNLASDVGVLSMPSPKQLSKLTYIAFSSNSFIGKFPHFNDCVELTQIHGNYVPCIGSFPTLERCAG